MNYTEMSESVSATFTALQAALAEQLSALRMEIGCAAEADQFERRDTLTDKAKRLNSVNDLVFQALQGYVEFARKEPNRTPPVPMQPNPTPPADPRPVVSHHKSPKTVLDVTFEGKRYRDKIAKATFLSVISAIGIERVFGLHLIKCNREFVSRQRHPQNDGGYPAMESVGEYHVIINLSTSDMKELLETICSNFSLAIEVKVVPPDVLILEEFGRDLT